MRRLPHALLFAALLAAPRGADGAPAADARRTELAALGPNGHRLAVYLDLGARDQAAEGGRSLRVTRGVPWTFPGHDTPAATVVYDAVEVVVEARGLEDGKAYVVGFTWGDADGKDRRQTVVFNPGEAHESTALPPSAPLAYHADQPTWQTVHLPVPAEAIRDGGLRVGWRRDAGPNAVVGEAWLLEKNDDVPRRRVVLLTGDDFRGHRWRETGPVLARHLRTDPRLEVTVTECPAFLASPLLGAYEAVVLHFKNYARTEPGPAAWRGLERFVGEGGGLVVVHFGCGAFQDWKGYAAVAGRTWDPARRGHDPYGLFRVRVADAAHPVTRGTRDYDTTDELYTCLSGDAPVRTLCDAESKVDGQTYPMAFVLDYGRGRVFHSTLGHDVKALSVSGTGALYRRAAAWACGLEPEKEKEP